jgi:hypothetical protein
MGKKKSSRKKTRGSSVTRSKSAKGSNSGAGKLKSMLESNRVKILGPLASLPLGGWVKSLGPDFSNESPSQPDEVTSYHFT